LPQALPAGTIGTPFIELQSVDSTNNYAREQVQRASLPESQTFIQHGQAYFAHSQFAGKGQRGKTWASEKHSNIAISILIDPSPLLLTQQFRLSTCMALSVYEFFKKYAGDDTRIKWPNDLYWQDRKAGGILVESVVGSRESVRQDSFGEIGDTIAIWKWAIVGIGININQVNFPPHLPNPVSLKQITGANHEPLLLAKELCTIIDRNFRDMIANGFEDILLRYNNHLYKKDSVVKLKKDNRVFEARVIGVNADGKLVIHHAIEEEIDFGEIEWVI
jgi:BirA family biotin operon repressor/biotin-[acetyl-CoA-carboxylase] ligase